MEIDPVWAALMGNRPVRPWWKFRQRPELYGALSAADREALEEVGDWVWCLRCQRVWPVPEIHLFCDETMLRYSESPWFFGCADLTCPGAGLGGYGELLGYTRTRRQLAPEWPPVPVPGEVLHLP